MFWAGHYVCVCECVCIHYPVAPSTYQHRQNTCKREAVTVSHKQDVLVILTRPTVTVWRCGHKVILVITTAIR